MFRNFVEATPNLHKLNSPASKFAMVVGHSSRWNRMSELKGQSRFADLTKKACSSVDMYAVVGLYNWIVELDAMGLYNLIGELVAERKCSLYAEPTTAGVCSLYAEPTTAGVCSLLG